MNIRSIQQLEDAVDSETGWRKRELTTVRFDAETARTKKRDTALRAGLALLYAHWEGWVKRIGENYISFVSEQKLTYEELSDPFLALALKSRMNEMAVANQPTLHLDFAVFLREKMASQAEFGSRRSVQTNANLGSEVFRKIVVSLGLDHSPYELYAPLIDQQMLKRRNQIAHGEYLSLNLDEFLVLHSKVGELLQRFTVDVLNSASRRLYLA